MAWSFKAMLAGTWPDRDWNDKLYHPDSELGSKANQPLAGQFYGCLIAIKGDLEFYNQSLGLPRWSVNKGPCLFCNAQGKGPSNWRNFLPTAPWKDTQWTPASWRAWPEHSKCPLFRVPGITASNAMVDYMHTKHLGCDQYMFAGVIYILVHHVMEGTPAQNMEAMFQEIKQLYKQFGIRDVYFGLGKLGMICRKKGGMKLRGKAAQVKGVTEPLYHVWLKYHSPALQLHRKIAQMLRANCLMEKMMAEKTRSDFFSKPKLSWKLHSKCAT